MGGLAVAAAPPLSAAEPAAAPCSVAALGGAVGCLVPLLLLAVLLYSTVPLLYREAAQCFPLLGQLAGLLLEVGQLAGLNHPGVGADADAEGGPAAASSASPSASASAELPELQQ